MENAYKEWVYNEIFRTIAERCEKAQQESSEDREDEFKSGRVLAYWEMSEIIKDRLPTLQYSYGRYKWRENKKCNAECRV